MSRAARLALDLLLLAAALALTGWVLIRLRLVVLPCLLALAGATVLWPLTDRLRARGWRPAPAAFAVLLGAAVVSVGIVTAITPGFADELDDVGVSVREGIGQAVGWLTDGPLDLSRAEVEDAVDDAAAQVRGQGGSLAQGVLSGALVVGEVVAGLLLAVVVLFFLLKDGPAIRSFLLARVPDEHRQRASRAAGAAWSTLGSYLRGIAVVGVVDSLLIGLALWLLGVPLVLPLMVLTFAGAFVPLVGAVTAGGVAALVALVAQGPLVALAVVVVIIVIQQVEGDVLYPLVVGRAIDLHALVVLLVLTAGAVTGGIVGALIAVPAVGVAWNAWAAWQSSS